MVLIKWQIKFLNANKIVLDTFLKLFVQKYYFEAKKNKNIRNKLLPATRFSMQQTSKSIS
jgi:hypothetical protein